MVEHELYKYVTILVDTIQNSPDPVENENQCQLYKRYSCNFKEMYV